MGMWFQVILRSFDLLSVKMRGILPSLFQVGQTFMSTGSRVQMYCCCTYRHRLRPDSALSSLSTRSWSAHETSDVLRWHWVQKLFWYLFRWTLYILGSLVINSSKIKGFWWALNFNHISGISVNHGLYE